MGSGEQHTKERSTGVAIRPLCAPWLVRFEPAALEVRVLLSGAGKPGGTLLWEGAGSAPPRTFIARTSELDRLDRDVFLARFTITDYDGRGGTYQIRCGAEQTPRFSVQPDPAPGEAWRFLLVSDHQGLPGATSTMQAVARAAARAPFHAILFAGDLVQEADDLGSWTGRRDPPAFFDSLAPLLSTAPIYVCPGNHDVSCTPGPGEEAYPWDLEVFTDLLLPAATVAPRGCYTATCGPLRILSLFVARRWVPGDHDARTGPCYEPPGRYIFEPITPGSEQNDWVRSTLSEVPDDSTLHVVLLHHPPYAQGRNNVPPFDDPLEYADNQVARHIVPLIEPWAHLAISGHNHAVNHHLIRGVHYFECSHMGCGHQPRKWLPDGSVAPEPGGNCSRFFAAEAGATYYTILEAVQDTDRVRARMSVHRVPPGGWGDEVYAFDL
jgi:hypothetical protein